MSEDPVLRKIQALVDKAYSTQFEAEREALLAKADELMLKYSIDQMQLLDPTRPNTAPNVRGSKPELREIVYMFSEDNRVDYEVRAAMRMMFRSVASYLMVRIGADSYATAKCVGYPADLDFLEMFFLRLKLHLVAHLDPRPDPNVPWQQSLVDIKNAGFKWTEVHERMRAHPEYPWRDREWDRNGFGTRLTPTMKQWCEAHNLPRNTATNLANWRYDFINAYVARIGERLREIRRKTIEQNNLLPALVQDKASAVQEAFWDEFPEFRPHPPECECDQCHGICRNEKCMRPRCVNWRKQKDKPIPKSHYRTRNFSAEDIGRRVANTADLSAGGQLHG